MQQILTDKLAKLTISVEEKVPDNNETTDPIFDGESCRTPTSKEHQIPEILSCPPAPRKRKGSFSDADKNETKKTVDDKEIGGVLFPLEQDSTSSM
ncbi:Myb domain protein 55 [Hibiscus syriacus]|uniref:Myb domain protein 55 n=1 Tax=Hibiscus syriacus TaxID=106335 RepID=A0A6A2XN19_HIBSY|nr:Myb domain protein 55 [Hibiscus syriacus]